MLLAAAFAGIGFGNAGVHLPHGMSYAVAGLVRNYIPAGFVSRHPIVPHGMSVILNAPAVFRFTAPSNPELHLRAAALMGADVAHVKPEDAGDILSAAVIDLMKKSGMPNGLGAIGYTENDLDALAAGTLPQQRIMQYAPRKADANDLKRLFRESMMLW
jgi:hydroxyacid-oxoacid transhydrogenase